MFPLPRERRVGRASSADAADPRARYYRTGRAKSVRAPFVGGWILDARSRGHAKRIGPLPVSISIDLSPEPRNRAISSHMTTLDIAGLTPKERLDLIGELWDSLAPEDVRLTPAHEAELSRRMATFEADASAAVPWETIEAELARKSR